MSGLLYSLVAEYQNDLKPDRDEMLGIYEYRRVFEYHSYDFVNRTKYIINSPTVIRYLKHARF